ncbi:MAG: helix-turn-helix domain-containing GNAT family N-acetyltransferase [Alphaproteobacteria bacterium]|nr:helix-turn-helix domain-containing GNAT family N-acetyltransferase [Alphaproteobacteria bacterium]
MTQADQVGEAGRIEAVRRFNRFYTRRIGVLREGLLDSPFSLTQARVIYELAQHPGIAAKALGADLGLDAGYLSRLLRGLREKGLVAEARSAEDGRRKSLRLTADGKAAFATLNARSRAEIGAILGSLAPRDRARLVRAMETIETTLGETTLGDKAEPAKPPPTKPVPSITLRAHRPGDIGWVIHSHGALYAREYGWDETFDALVARVTADFIDNFDADRERCWIAEMDGVNVGSIFLVKHTDTVAKLRLLLVDPAARGHGLGRRLVEECIAFARIAGYAKITLWTNDILHAARHIYETLGFVLVDEEHHHSFGQDLVGQTWELDLATKSG